MMKPSRSFTDEFKREAALLASNGRPLMQITEEFGHSAGDAAAMAQRCLGACGGVEAPDTQAGWRSR
jgi:hypothetical protein